MSDITVNITWNGEIPSYLRTLKTVRLGEEERIISGVPLNIGVCRDIIINSSELKKYKQLNRLYFENKKYKKSC